MEKEGRDKRGKRSRAMHRMVSIAVSHYCEVVRWVLERENIPYTENLHSPGLHLLAVRLNQGRINVPVLVTTETTLTDARQSLEYIDTRLPPDKRLYPADPRARKETEHLLNRFLDDLGIAVRRFSCSHYLPERKTLLPLMIHGVPVWQKIVVYLGYPLVAALLARGIPANPEIAAESEKIIKEVFDEVEALLADGRKYLQGEQLSIADIVFASMVAPVLAPAKYAGQLPDEDRIPEASRRLMQTLRNRPAGHFALRIYEDHRPKPAPAYSHHPASTSPAGTLQYRWSRFLGFFTGYRVQRLAFWVLRRLRPVFVFGKIALVTRDKDVRETLGRDEVFRIAKINAPNMDRLNGPFILGMDRSDMHTKELAALRKAVKPDDRIRIQEIARFHTDYLIQAALPYGRIDMVSSLARPVAARMITDYFGVPGRNETEIMHWMRAMFYDLFLNLSDDETVRATAEQAAADLKYYLKGLIQERKQQILQGAKADDILSRLISMQINQEIDLDDDGIRRNISGLIVGALDTTSKTSTLAMEQLLKRPVALREAGTANQEKMLHLTYEALRFNTMAPVIIRHCQYSSTIDDTLIPENARVFIATASAMFDKQEWPKPGEFQNDRPIDNYVHFGDGMHRCFGEYVNRIQLPIIVGALARLPGVRRAGSILYDGPFPDQFMLAFDSK